jgi:hypothetical protein
VLNITAWNCNGLTEEKLNDEEFLKLIKSNDIVFLSETWTDNDSDIGIDGYSCFNFYRKFRNKRAKRNSGGIVIYVRDLYKDGVTVVKNNFDTIIWLKLDKSYFGFDTDVYLCGLYLWPDDSPITQIFQEDLFDVLSNDVFHFEEFGKVLLIGDWNCRVGNRNDYIYFDSYVDGLDYDSYTPDVSLERASSDKLCNARGIQMLDFCKATSLRIANGRIGNDYNTGAFTYYNRNACTTIDYLVLFARDFPMIDSFNVLPFNPYSDHAPIHFSLKVDTKETEQNYFTNIGTSVNFKWNDAHKTNFRRDIIAKLPQFNEILLNVNLSNTVSNNTIDKMVEDFSVLIQSTADPYFKQHSKRNVASNCNREWFDQECRVTWQDYQQALRLFNINKTVENREVLCDSKLRYKSLVKKKKKGYKLLKSKELSELRRKKPRDFWKYFKHNASPDNSCTISPDEFRDYFSNLFNDIHATQIDEIDNFSNNHDFNINNPTFESLNTPITTGEIREAISRMKRNKASCPVDNLLNEYFIETADILTGHITDCFNKIFDSGFFPESWSYGYIVPLYKKGNKNSPNNYRGITLISNFGKLFTSVLTKRVENWSNQFNVSSDAQFGFRHGVSTVDAVFVLNTLVEYVLSQKSRLYCAFIDLKKAFDSVYRNALWFKLYKLGLDGKILRIFKAMYATVKSCVKHCNTVTEFFDISLGLRQGLNNSPILFSLFLEDIELFLQENISSGLSLFDLCLIILLFADDMVILANSPEDLQASLNKLFEYCSKWGLEVNTDKTKIMVFRNRGPLKNNEKWYYNDNSLETVENFNYLGVVFNYTGSFTLNNQYVTGKALKAMSVLLRNISKYDVTANIAMQLFDSFVGSVLNYSCAVWGFSKSKDLERIHLKFCKSILGVKQSTCTAAVYSEIGRYPLFIKRYEQIIKYWLNVIQSDNIILKTIICASIQLHEKGIQSWASKVHRLLNEYGFSDVWNNPFQYDVNYFVKIFKQRVIDCFLQKLISDISNSPVLSNIYVHLYRSFEMADYLKILHNKTYRNCLSRLRLSAHKLRIETGRYGANRLPRNERICRLCDNNDIEDEFHFIFVCNCYSNIRSLYIKPFYYRRPSMHKLIELLSTTRKPVLVNLCKYIHFATKHRNELLNVM